MATALDNAWGLKKESTFGSAVTVDRFYPWVDGCDFSGWDVRPRQGKGIPGGAGARTDLGSRWYLTTGQGKLTTKVELESKAAGVVLDMALGVSTVTSITGGSQQVFHRGVTGMYLPSANIQAQIVQNDGTLLTQTFRGCTATKVTLEQPEDDTAMLTVEWDALGRTTATGAATVTYATTPTIFDGDDAVVGYGGTLTVPSTTALASGLNASAVWRSWKLELDHGAAIDRRVLNSGVRNQPTVGKPSLKLTGSVELNDAVISGAYAAGTKNAWYTTYTTPEALGAGYTQLQVVLPQIVFTKGLPEGKFDTPVVMGVEAEVKNDGTNRDLYVVVRTSDTVL